MHSERIKRVGPLRASPPSHCVNRVHELNLKKTARRRRRNMKFNPRVVGIVCASVILLAAIGFITYVQVNRSRRRMLTVVKCTGDGCNVVVPPLTRERVAASVFVPDIGPRYAAFNASAAVVHNTDGTPVLLGTARVSSATFCPNRTMFDDMGSVGNHIVMTLNGQAARVAVPDDMMAELWPEGARNVGFEDARPFDLAPGVVGCTATVVLQRDNMVPRMCIIVLPLPSHADLASDPTLTPRAVVLLDPTHGTPQKNWMPFVAGSNVWLVQQVAPQTNMTVAVDTLLTARGVETIRASLERTVDNDTGALRHLGARPSVWRGSSPLVRLWGRMDRVAMIHRRERGLEYEHAVASFNDYKPFRLARVSRPFRLTMEGVGFMYVAGIVSDPSDEHTVLITAGGDDCYVITVAFDLDAINLLMEQGVDAPLLTLSASERVTRQLIEDA